MQVANHIRQAIIHGELRRGDRIRQDEIADALGVSRIPVREAIIALDREGWLTFEANRGAFVTGLSANDVRDHYALRGYVFGLIARRAAEVVTDEEIAELAALQKAMRAARTEQDFGQANGRMLSRLVQVADSQRFRAALLVTPSILSAEDFFAVVPDARQVQTQGMAKLVKALRAGDPDAADQSQRDVLTRQGKSVLAALDAAGLLQGDLG